MTKKIGVLGLALVLALPVASSAAKGSRTATGEYNTIGIDTDDPPTSGEAQLTNGVVFKPRKGERFVSVTLEDQSGLPARAVVGQDLDGDGVRDSATEICGATTSPIKFRKGIDVMVVAQEGPCSDNTVAMATFGTVTATFTKAVDHSKMRHKH